ncbi:hypothetical protein RclHR1_06660002 [Rhizophagus clarus]|uniref:Uncharacterized protein n=1 Tax=Rhizophagus clarus TaxID=94130 RepID=A0A2Z6SJI6_9GLOM|nr:hypothetical protein RclHR1_06660002 [Rhizophagus clarus]
MIIGVLIFYSYFDNAYSRGLPSGISCFVFLENDFLELDFSLKILAFWVFWDINFSFLGSFGFRVNFGFLGSLGYQILAS